MTEIFHHCECLGRDFTREEWKTEIAAKNFLIGF